MLISKTLRLLLLPLAVCALAGCGDDDARLGGSTEYMHGLNGNRVAANYNQHTQAERFGVVLGRRRRAGRTAH